MGRLATDRAAERDGPQIVSEDVGVNIVLWRQAAEDDLIELAAYIAADSPTAAERFIQEVEHTVEIVRISPRIGQPFISRLKSLRSIRYRHPRGFRNHAVYYREVPAGIEIVAVLHGATRTRQRLRGR